MKLHYCKYPDGSLYPNFGDALNPWLWKKLLPGVFDDDETVTFVGMGTLINDALPRRTSKSRQRIIFSTGVGYEKGVPTLDESYKIYCLRGPLSAKKLGVSEDLAVTDGAVLIRRLVQPEGRKINSFSYMPHYNFAGEGWKSVCDSLGFGYIDPSGSTEQILSSIGQTEVLLTEAMHGAIVADALRIPWIAIVTHPSILAFKWQDWCLSVGVQYEPTYMKRLHQPSPKIDWMTPLRTSRNWVRQRIAASELANIAKQVRPTLSQESEIERVTIELETRLLQLKADIQSGILNATPPKAWIV